MYELAAILTHYPMGDIDTILNMQFSILIFLLVSSDILYIIYAIKFPEITDCFCLSDI